MSCTGLEHVLVHAPYGRDAAMICQFLTQAGISAGNCPTVESLCSALGESPGAALLSDQSLTKADVAALAAVLRKQPPWSDLPLIVTTSGGGELTERNRRQLDVLKPLGNVSLLERPLRAVTLVSCVQTALRARRRQYQVRENFAERARLMRELERSNDELAQFAHIVSHDLQAPIRLVRTYSQLLAHSYKGRLDPTADKYIHTIQNGAEMMEALVRTLLNYASFGQGPIVVRRISLPDVVHAVVTMLQPTIEQLGANVSCGDLPMIDGDGVLLQELIQNLVGNALKYRDPLVTPRVHISSEQAEGQWIVSVKDNGPGIAPEHRESVFLPLKRLHGDRIPGTGMGLAVCRKIVERHGGKIWVKNEIGNGATFCFALPIPEAWASSVSAAS